MDNNNYDLITIKLARAEQPKFEERKGQGYIQYGANNDYPDYLLGLYNESPKHGAIVKGKTKYIYGKGFEGVPKKANTKGEAWNKVFKKCVADDEIFSGYYLQVIWNLLGQVKDVYHIEFRKCRTNKDKTKFFVKNDWNDTKEKVREYPAFSTDPEIIKQYPSQILFIEQYNPQNETYPRPEYFQALNYIESDVQIGRHILGNAKDGFVPGTLINLNGGEPAVEKKAAVEKGIKKKFTGSEGDRVLIMFNSSKDNSAEILPLNQTMLTKEDFTNVNLLVQQEIFAGHSVTTPALFGIKTEGQLGGRTELRDGYEIFNNTYVSERQEAHEETFNALFKLAGIEGEFKIIPVEPIKFEFSESIISQNLTKDEIREIAGKEPLEPEIKNQAQIISDNINSLSPLVANKVLESMTPDEIRSLAGLIPSNGQPLGGDGSMPTPAASTNSNLANMTGRQFQHLDRIKRKYATGKLSRVEAAMLLKNSFGLSEEDISILLDTNSEDQQFSDQELVDFALLQQFSEHGESREVFEELSRKPANEVEYFKDVMELNKLQSNILELVKKDSKITPEVIAKALKTDAEVVAKILRQMESSGVLNKVMTKVGEDEVAERTLTDKSINTEVTKEILIRYSYEGPKDAKNRPFCAKLMDLNRLYSRSDIEQISERLGYSVWDRRGGWFTQPDGAHRPYCRHRWFALTVIKKK